MISLNIFYIDFRSGTRLVTLANAFQNGYVLASSTARRSAAEMNEMIVYVTVPWLAKMTQQSSTADKNEFQWHHQLGGDGILMETKIQF